MIGEVTRRMLPHLSGVPHLHVNRPLVQTIFIHELWRITKEWIKIAQTNQRDINLLRYYKVKHYQWRDGKKSIQTQRVTEINLDKFITINIKSFTISNVQFFFDNSKEKKNIILKSDISNK